MLRRPPRSTLFPYTRSSDLKVARAIGNAGRVIAAVGAVLAVVAQIAEERQQDRKSTRLNSSHVAISYAVFCLKKKKKQTSYSMHPRQCLRNTSYNSLALFID